MSAAEVTVVSSKQSRLMASLKYLKETSNLDLVGGYYYYSGAWDDALKKMINFVEAELSRGNQISRKTVIRWLKEEKHDMKFLRCWETIQYHTEVTSCQNRLAAGSTYYEEEEGAGFTSQEQQEELLDDEEVKFLLGQLTRMMSITGGGMRGILGGMSDEWYVQLWAVLDHIKTQIASGTPVTKDDVVKLVKRRKIDRKFEQCWDLYLYCNAHWQSHSKGDDYEHKIRFMWRNYKPALCHKAKTVSASRKRSTSGVVVDGGSSQKKAKQKLDAEQKRTIQTACPTAGEEQERKRMKLTPDSTSKKDKKVTDIHVNRGNAPSVSPAPKQDQTVPQENLLPSTDVDIRKFKSTERKEAQSVGIKKDSIQERVLLLPDANSRKLKSVESVTAQTGSIGAVPFYNGDFGLATTVDGETLSLPPSRPYTQDPARASQVEIRISLLLSTQEDGYHPPAPNRLFKRVFLLGWACLALSVGGFIFLHRVTINIQASPHQHQTYSSAFWGN